MTTAGTIRTVLTALATLLLTLTMSIAQETRPVDVVVILDTSGSMQDLLDAARARVWDVVNELGRMKPTPEFGNRCFFLEKRLCCKLSEGTYTFRLDGPDLAFKKRHTCGYLRRFGISIVWWTALDNIANVDIVPGKMHGFQNPI